MFATRLTSIVLAALVASVLVGAADVKKGVGLDKISLPSGPGSIEGLGDAFEPQLNSGTSAYSVKVAIPPGVNGLQPEVVLRYNAGSGNGAFGLAWSWSPMSIQRQVEKGIPTYGGTDAFTFMGEELVSLSDGTFRVENESSFMRIRRLGEGWEIHDKSGKRYILGTNSTARVSKPGGTSFTQGFKWLVESVTDVHGNRMEYLYSAFADSPGELYCTEIRYSIFGANFHSVHFDFELRTDAFSSFLSGFEVRTARRCREIAVRSQGSLIRRYTLSYTPDANDPVEAVSAGDVGQLFSLLRKVTQFDNRAVGQAAYLPPLRFGYTRMDGALTTSGRLTGTPPFSLGNPQLAIADINCDSLPDLLYTDPLTGQHTVYYNLGNGAFAPGTNFVAFPANVRLGGDTVQLNDLDGDGRIDLVEKFGGANDRFVFYPNLTKPFGNDDSKPAWGGETSYQGPFPPFDFSDPAVRSLDLDNDKLIDFMRTTPNGFEYYLNRTNRWETRGLFLFGEPEMGDLTAADNIQFSKAAGGGAEVPNEQVKLADMNGDRLLDLVRISQFGTLLEVTFWPDKGAGTWGSRVAMTGNVDLGTLPLEDVQLRDINGDGLADVVAVGYNFVSFWINRGNNTFSPEFRRDNTPVYIRGQTVLQQADINGNGSTDFLWENFNPATGNYDIDYVDFLGATKPNLLATIDNGIGLRTAIEYRSTTEYYLADRAAGVPWHTRLPFPSQVVSKITKRLGVDLDGKPGPDEYASELFYYDGYYDEREKEFRGFAFAKKVERGDDRYTGTNAITIHSPSTVTRFGFHTGVPDGLDNNDNSQIDELQGRSGYEEEPLKGKVLWTEVTLLTADVGGAFPAQTNGLPASDAVVFTRETNTWRIKLIHGPTNGFSYVDAFGTAQPAYSLAATTTDGRRVTFAFQVANRKEIIEANGTLAGLDPLIPVRAKKLIYSESDVDFFGNTILDKDYGEHSPGSTYDDERFTYSTYAFNLDAWLIGLPAIKRVTDETGQFVAESRSYYDGTAFAGLPLGQVGTRGLMHRSEQLVNGTVLPPAFATISKAVGDPRLAASYAINTTRAQYDAFGNLTLTRDPLYSGAGQGHEKEYTYDPVFHTYVEQETIRVGNGSADLVASATYDRGAGVMVGFTDFNGNSTSFQYDSFWRLVGIVKPGDTAQFPTAAFEYRPGDPFRGLYYNYAANGSLTLVNTAEPNVVNTVTTHQREVAGQAGTFDTMSFTDGAGHKLGTLHEDAVAGQWVAKDFKRYSSQGEERKAFLPFLTGSTTYSVPTETQTHVASFYDAASRVVRTVNPPESTNANALVTQTKTIYLPLETQLFDEEDINPASPYYNTPHIQLKDGLDRLIGVIEVTKLNDDGTAAGGVNQWLTSYAYDLNDNLTHITDSQGNQKWFRYDGLKRKLFMNDPDRGVMEYAYDQASNLTNTLDAKTQRIAYTYDGVNRLLSENYFDGKTNPVYRSILDPVRSTNSVAYFYDTPLANVPVGDGSAATARNAKGMLAYVQDLSGEEHTSYDARGRVEHVIKRLPDPVFLSTFNLQPSTALVSYRTAFAYDSLDRVTTLTYPDSDVVGYQYNARNLLTRITGGPSGSIITNITYRASDQLTQIDYGNNVRTTYDYDPRLRLNSLLTVSQPSTLNSQLLNFSYEFDGVSNIKAIRDQRPGTAVASGDKRRNTQLFQYDDLYRITRAQYSFALPGVADANNGSITYRYDRIGNMMNQSSDIVHNDRGVSVTDLGTMNYGGTGGRQKRIGRTTAEPGPHALTSVSTGNRAFPYDLNGNMTVIDGLTNTWDFKDRLIQVADTNMVATYTYDYTDRRVAKRVAWKTASTNNLTGLTNNSVLYPDKYFEVREADAPVKYVWNGNTRVARVTGSLTTSLRTQRLRVYPGMNLVSLAVTATNALSQLSTFNPQLVSARRWNPGTFAWVNVAPTDTLAAGTVLWVEMATNATLTVTGTYAEPANQALQPGVNFVSGWGLQPLKLADALPVSTAAWKYDAPSRRWGKRLTGELQTISDVPAMLTPGDALFARPEVLATLTVPESALAVRYYHQDHLGSSSVLTDAAGALVSETANYAFGFARNEFLPRNLREPYQFTQKEKDGESANYYFEMRYLVSTLACFSRVDSIALIPSETRFKDPQQLHPYTYVANRPMGVIDPNGKAGLKLASEVLMLLHGGDETLKGVNRAGTASVTAWVEGAIDLQGVKAATSHEANSSRKPNLPGFGGSEPLKESIAKTSTAISELRGKIETLSRAKDLIDAMNNDAILMLHEATSGSIRGDWKFDKENLRSIGNDLGAAVSNYGKQLKVMEKQLDGLQKLDKMMSPISSPQEPQRQNLPRNKPDAGGVRG
jgi:RHS repeat-associated protein